MPPTKATALPQHIVTTPLDYNGVPVLSDAAISATVMEHMVRTLALALASAQPNASHDDILRIVRAQLSGIPLPASNQPPPQQPATTPLPPTPAPPPTPASPPTPPPAPVFRGYNNPGSACHIIVNLHAFRALFLAIPHLESWLRTSPFGTILSDAVHHTNYDANLAAIRQHLFPKSAESTRHHCASDTFHRMLDLIRVDSSRSEGLQVFLADLFEVEKSIIATCECGTEYTAVQQWQGIPLDCGAGTKHPLRPTAHLRTGTWEGIPTESTDLCTGCGNMFTDLPAAESYSSLPRIILFDIQRNRVH